MEEKSRFTRDASQKIAAALLSGLLLFSAFPPLEFYFLAWVALAPLMLISFFCGPGRSFLHGFLAGAFFWLLSISWLTRVSFIGWFLISLYCASFIALFTLIASWWFSVRKARNTGSAGRFADLPMLFALPALWVGLEYARAHFLTGFPWNLIGVSQYASLRLIQCADFGGIYIVSFLVVMANTALALVLSSRRAEIIRPATAMFAFLLIFYLSLEYGRARLARLPATTTVIRAAAIQPNVPQQLKWSEKWAGDICSRLKKAMAEVCREKSPDLIVWPETALPDFIQFSEPSRELVADALSHKTPLLIGMMDYADLNGKTNYFNSSFLYLPGEAKPQVYAKRHLVPFGEYVPLGNYLSFLRAITEIYDDFTAGEKNVIFRLNGTGQKFSVLICFEDILPCLARECVKAGARLLINQTNDAWFDPSWASRQHMSHCVFRCVENRVACLRASNTGMTCLIDRCGVIRSTLAPVGREPRGPEIMMVTLPFAPETMPLSFYTRHGDLFALACLAFSLPLFAGFLLSFMQKRK